MRHFVLYWVTAFGLGVGGCGPGRTGADDYDATIDTFLGQIVQNGKPVTFEPGEKVVLQLVFHDRGERFGIPVQPDGSFKIGWMPVGAYTAVLERTAAPKDGRRGSGAPSTYTVPGGLIISDQKTKYEVELGKDWKP